MSSCSAASIDVPSTLCSCVSNTSHRLRNHIYRRTTHHKSNHLQEEAEGQEKPKHQLPQLDAASDCARWHQVEGEQEKKKEKEEEKKEDKEEEKKEEKEACQLSRLHGGQERIQREAGDSNKESSF
ncbi:hypothetical protein TURU_008826 [Turdus rufiventris]|nr:hypothetical protein TURU_008826 [Turdus rufiventris]